MEKHIRCGNERDRGWKAGSEAREVHKVWSRDQKTGEKHIRCVERKKSQMNGVREMSINCYKLGVPLHVITTAASVEDEVVTGWIKEDAEERMARLFKLLLSQERIEDAKRAAEDREYLESLMRELGV